MAQLRSKGWTLTPLVLGLVVCLAFATASVRAQGQEFPAAEVEYPQLFEYNLEADLDDPNLLARAPFDPQNNRQDRESTLPLSSCLT